MNVNVPTFGLLHNYDRRARLLLLLSIVSSTIYLIGQVWRPMPGSLVFKAFSIAPLAMITGLRTQAGVPHQTDYVILAAALSCSCLGDVLLDLDGERLFAQGLFAFLVAHLLYLLLFVRHWPRPVRLKGAQAALLILVLGTSWTLARLLAPHLGALRLPVSIYICAITAMVVAAIIARFRGPWVWLGAVLFLFSDSIIAIHKFIAPIAARNFLVWATYYLGQCAIALGFLHEKAKRKE